MAITNFTGGGKQAQIVKQLECSTVQQLNLTGGMHEQLIYLSAFNIFLSITAFLGNTLILVALDKESSLHPPSKLLYRCLATTDLCVGLISEPVLNAYWISLVHEEWIFCGYSLVLSDTAGYVLASVTLLTMTAISVDRLLALLLGLRYRQVVTLKRMYVAVAAFWVISIAVAASYLANKFISYWYGSIGISLCLATSIVSYTKIFVTLRHHQTQVQDHGQQQQPSQTAPLNIARYKKAVSSALWVQIALVICYLPYAIVRSWINSRGLTSSSFRALAVTVTLVYLNSSLNPFLYCWKISEVRQAVKQTIRQVLCCV